jgi:ATP-dependent RNA helicase RhlE
MQQVLVFTVLQRTARTTWPRSSNKNGIDARATHGKKSHHARQQALADFKAGKLRALVATDLLSRAASTSSFLPICDQLRAAALSEGPRAPHRPHRSRAATPA